MSKKPKSVESASADEFLSQETCESSIPLESGDWVSTIKSGDFAYSAEYVREEDGNERIKVLTLRFDSWDKSAVADAKTRMANLTPIIDGKEAKKVTVSSQNIKRGFFPSKISAVRALYEQLDSMAETAKQALDKLEAETKKAIVKVANK